jgi:hypothetical protein
MLIASPYGLSLMVKAPLTGSSLQSSPAGLRPDTAGGKEEKSIVPKNCVNVRDEAHDEFTLVV